MQQVATTTTQQASSKKHRTTILDGSAHRGDRGNAFFGALTCDNCNAEVAKAAGSCDNCGMPIPEGQAAPQEAPTQQASAVPPDHPTLPPLPPRQQSTFDLSLPKEEAPPRQEEEVPRALREGSSARDTGGPSGANRTIFVAQPKRALLLAAAIVALLVLGSGGLMALGGGVGPVASLQGGSESPQPVDEAQPPDSQEEGTASGEDTAQTSFAASADDASVSSPMPGSPSPVKEVTPSVAPVKEPTKQKSSWQQTTSGKEEEAAPYTPYPSEPSKQEPSWQQTTSGKEEAAPSAPYPKGPTKQEPTSGKVGSGSSRTPAPYTPDPEYGDPHQETSAGS